MLAPLGLVGGVVDAIGGGGWGPITTPTLITVGQMAPHRAVGTAAASEFVVSLAASIGFLAGVGTKVIDPAVVAGLLVGGAVVAPLAAWLVRRASGRFLGVAVGTLLVATNLRTLLIDAPTSMQRLAVTAVIIAGGLTAAKVELFDRASSRRHRSYPPGSGGGLVGADNAAIQSFDGQRRAADDRSVRSAMHP
jgi:hypothetical protein